MKKSSKNLTSDGYIYFTKRLLISKAKAAGRKAQAEAMAKMGYVVIAKDGWIVRKYKDGHIERIEEIQNLSTSGTIVLD